MTYSPKIGHIVTCRSSKHAYYSDYGGNPSCMFDFGDVGVVSRIRVPNVTGSNRFFNCIDFVKVGRVWRVAYYPEQLRLLAESFEELKSHPSILDWQAGLCPATRNQVYLFHIPKVDGFNYPDDVECTFSISSSLDRGKIFANWRRKHTQKV